MGARAGLLDGEATVRALFRRQPCAGATETELYFGIGSDAAHAAGSPALTFRSDR